MKPTVRSLGIHLPNEKVVLAAGPRDALEKVDLPSPLERYLLRPEVELFTPLTYVEYYARYSVDARATSARAIPDRGEPPHFANTRRKQIMCMLNNVRPSDEERFALRLLLRSFAVWSWEKLLTRHGGVGATFHEAACAAGLIKGRQDEAEICMQDPVDMNRPPSELRFMMAQMIEYGANREALMARFIQYLGDYGDTEDVMNAKIDGCSAGVRRPFVHRPEDEEDSVPVDDDVALQPLTDEQRVVARRIINCITENRSQLMFLE
jgi:hypothetical protein